MSNLQAPVVAAVITAFVVLTVGLLTLAQKTRNDHREDWWKRAQWAFDKVASADPYDREVGSTLLGHLVRERGVRRSDNHVVKLLLLRAFTDRRSPGVEERE